MAITRPIYEAYEGLYFPIPVELVPAIVPSPGDSRHIEVSYDYLADDD